MRDWILELSSDQGVILARRSISLSKTYPILGIFMAVLGLVVSSVSRVVGNLSAGGIPVNATSVSPQNVSAGIPFIAVPLQAFAAIMYATPVLLLFVYDKNNGVLEYFLSLGMSQRDIYRRYLKAALILSSVLACFVVVVDIVAGVVENATGLMLEVAGLVVLLSFPVVVFSTLIMMSFSSLQKQRVGSNQPLGMAIGVFIVFPTYFSPFLAPSLAPLIDLLLAGIIVVISLVMYLSSSRLISREKLLP
jgi:hypothetical protein